MEQRAGALVRSSVRHPVVATAQSERHSQCTVKHIAHFLSIPRRSVAARPGLGPVRLSHHVGQACHIVVGLLQAIQRRHVFGRGAAHSATPLSWWTLISICTLQVPDFQGVPDDFVSFLSTNPIYLLGGVAAIGIPALLAQVRHPNCIVIFPCSSENMHPNSV